MDCASLARRMLSAMHLIADYPQSPRRDATTEELKQLLNEYERCYRERPLVHPNNAGPVAVFLRQRNNGCLGASTSGTGS